MDYNGGDRVSRSRNGGVVIRSVDPADGAAVARAIELGDRGSSTLGHLPYAAYRDAAARGWLVVAGYDDDVVGFALYALTKRWVRLIQLYVDPEWRRRGIARSLVDWIASRHSSYPGIRVTCRQDYGLAAAWTALGFARGAETPGRGRDHRVLVAWWRDHHHPKLFDWNRPDVLVRASIDLNVLRDLDDPTRPGHNEALALVGDQLSRRLELVRTGTLDVEIDALGDPASRDRCARRARDLEAVSPPRPDATAIEEELRTAVPEAFTAQPNGKRDIRYVSEAISAGLTVFVSQDQELRRVLGSKAADRGLRILTPADVVVHIDELTDAGAYRPAAVGDTAYRVQRLGTGADDLLLAMANAAGGEHLTALRRRIKDLTARGVSRHGVFAPHGELVAAYMAEQSTATLDVQLLRVKGSPLADTLLRQMLFRLRTDARVASLSAIRITDPNLAAGAQAAALDDGYLRTDQGLVGLVLDVCGSARSVHDAACRAARAAGISEPASVRTEVAEVVAAVERAWWPAKVTDASLPTYLVPIRQPFSTPLLGYPSGLFARDDLLGLRREHVYYRSPRGVRLSGPGRILWYASGSKGRAPAPAGVVGCSSLDEVIEDEPHALHDRFRHLGVWREDQVAGSAHDGVAQALHFSGTEVFASPVTLARMRELDVDPPMAPRLIATDVFAILYREGQRHG